MRKGGSPLLHVGGRAGLLQVGAQLLVRHVAEQRNEALGDEHGVALVAHGEQVARPRHVDHRLHAARLVAVGADVPPGRWSGRAEQRHEMPARTLPPGPDFGGVDVEAAGVGAQVADGAFHVDDLVGPVAVRAEPVVEADHDEAAGGQRRPDAVDDEAAGVVVPRDPGAAVDVDGGRGRAVQAGGLGDPRLLVVAVADRDLLAGRLEGRGRGRRGLGRRRRRRPPEPGAPGPPCRARRQVAHAQAPPHRPRCWPIGARLRSRPAGDGPRMAPDLIRRQN